MICQKCEDTKITEEESHHNGDISYSWCECAIALGKPRWGNPDVDTLKFHQYYWYELNKQKEIDSKFRKMMSRVQETAWDMGAIAGYTGTARREIFFSAQSEYNAGYHDGEQLRIWELKNK